MRNMAVIMTIALCACSTSMQSDGTVAGVSLTAAPTTARDSIVLTLRNGSTGDVAYNLCSAAVERRVNGTWQNVASDRVCTMELRTLPAGQDATFTSTLPAGAAAGDYRFVARVEIPVGGEMRSVSSNTIRVQ